MNAAEDYTACYESICKANQILKKETRPGKNLPPDPTAYEEAISQAFTAAIVGLRTDPSGRGLRAVRFLVSVANKIAAAGGLEHDETASLITDALAWTADTCNGPISSHERNAIADDWEKHVTAVFSTNYELGMKLLDNAEKPTRGCGHAGSRVLLLRNVVFAEPLAA